MDSESSNDSSGFFRTMLAMAALDAVLLLWILNPLSQPSNSLPEWQRSMATQSRSAMAVDSADKPSPAGRMARSENSRRALPARSTVPARARLVTAAYRQLPPVQ